MEAYSDFASVYDIFMDETPYEEWARFLSDKLRSEHIEGGIVLDLGCGTGSLTRLLSENGYDMIGVDNSPQMLQIAMEKEPEDGHILYLLQDMREFELYGTVAAVVSVCDSINYITDEEDLLQVFRLVNNYLDPDGVFIFDFNTEYKYREVIGDTVIAENREDCSFIWENYYDRESCINEYDLTIFVRQKGDLFHKFEETHLQKGYTLAQIRELLEKAGLKFLQAMDADTKENVREDSERIYVMAKECTKVSGRNQGGKEQDTTL